MTSEEEKVIELSKAKILFLTLGSMAFVALGLWMLSLDAAFIEDQRRFNSPVFVYGVGVAAILFFGLCGIIAARKFFDKSPGLILNKHGIIDNSSGVSAGFIPWSEVEQISQYEIQKQRFVCIHVKEPEKYLERGGFLKRAANKANFRMCGAPINISANSLKISYEDLFSTIEKFSTTYREER